MPFFRRSEAVDLPTAMSGIELGDRLLVVGCSDPMPIARLARRVGLTGRAGAVDESSQRVAAAGRTAEREGAPIETAVAPPAVLPYEPAAFDVVVLRDMAAPGIEQRTGITAEARRVLTWRPMPCHRGSAAYSPRMAGSSAGSQGDDPCDGSTARRRVRGRSHDRRTGRHVVRRGSKAKLNRPGFVEEGEHA